MGSQRVRLPSILFLICKYKTNKPSFMVNCGAGNAVMGSSKTRHYRFYYTLSNMTSKASHLFYRLIKFAALKVIEVTLWPVSLPR